MKVMAYVRVSREEEARNGVGLSVQRDKIEAYVRTFDLDLVDVVVDDGYSGKDLKRPGIDAAMDRVLDGEADALIVYRVDRLARNTRDFLNLVSKLEDYKKGFISIREQMNTSTPHGRFAMTMLAAVGQLEREMIQERCKDAAERCFREKRVFGKIPYGYRKDGKKLVENSIEMDVLRMIDGLRSDGVSFWRIADRLNTRGIKAKQGGEWYASSVRSVLETHRKLSA